jgi:hypothetical protein
MGDSNQTKKETVPLRWEWEMFLLFSIPTAVLFSFHTEHWESGIMAFTGLAAIVAPLLMALRRMK